MQRDLRIFEWDSQQLLSFWRLPSKKWAIGCPFRRFQGAPARDGPKWSWEGSREQCHESDCTWLLLWFNTHDFSALKVGNGLYPTCHVAVASTCHRWPFWLVWSVAFGCHSSQSNRFSDSRSRQCEICLANFMTYHRYGSSLDGPNVDWIWPKGSSRLFFRRNSEFSTSLAEKEKTSGHQESRGTIFWPKIGHQRGN